MGIVCPRTARDSTKHVAVAVLNHQNAILVLGAHVQQRLQASAVFFQAVYELPVAPTVQVLAVIICSHVSLALLTLAASVGTHELPEERLDSEFRLTGQIVHSISVVSVSFLAAPDPAHVVFAKH